MRSARQIGRRTATLALAALLGSACATARNYLDPDGPLYVGGRATAPPRRAALRIVTFNIEYAKRVDAALALLREPPLRDADVLALQEMDAPGVERVATALDLNYVYFPSSLLSDTGRDFGTAILSPWPLVEPRKLLLPHASRIKGGRRAVTIATLDRGADRLRVYSVHLPSPLGVSGAQRRDQVRMILADAAASADPVLVVGDFNTREVGRLFEDQGFRWISKAVGTTTRRAGMSFSFDHIFAKGLPLTASFEAAAVPDNRGASDHRPVWAVVTLR
jgi:endonuclease/exonuclease/phosphatase family metal-dependent hydrolase